MSRSYHQHHSLSRRSKMSNCKHWKMRPYGLKRTGEFGGEAFFRSKNGRYSHGLNGDYIFPVVEKNIERNIDIDYEE